MERLMGLEPTTFSLGSWPSPVDRRGQWRTGVDNRGHRAHPSMDRSGQRAHGGTDFLARNDNGERQGRRRHDRLQQSRVDLGGAGMASIGQPGKPEPGPGPEGLLPAGPQHL